MLKKIQKNKERELKKILKGSVLYIGVKFDAEEIKTILRKLGYPEHLINLVKREVHMTTVFRPKEGEIYPNELLGKEVTVTVVAVGELRENGILKNVGLKVLDEKKLSRNNVAHITCLIANGGQARNTGNCDFDTPVNIKLKGKFAAFDGLNNWTYEVVAA